MSITAQCDTKANGSQACAGKYLSFSLHKELYAVPVLKVREIIKLVPVSQVPQLPSHIRGVVNLRGKIIPVLDLRMKFGMECSEDTEHTCIVVAQVTLASRLTVAMGLVVDSVEEVTNIAANDIEETPVFGTSVDMGFIHGMAKIKGKVVSMLDLDRVLGGETIPMGAGF